MNRKAAWLSFSLLAALAVGRGAAAVDPVRAEAARLQAALDARYAHDPAWKGTAPAVAGALRRARQALDAGFLYRALEELGAARLTFRIAEILQAEPQASMSGLDAEWRRARVDLAAFDREARARRWAERPAALRALAETAAGQAPALVDASRAYGAATRPQYGLGYLAEARAQVDLSGFYSSLALARPGAPFPPRSIQPELRRLQKQVDDAFRPPRSIQLHPQFIRLNATLKTAGELDLARRFAGALYQYLDAVEQLALLDAAAPGGAGQAQAQLRQALASQRAEIRRSGRDDSILQLFLERAQMAIGGGGIGGMAPGPDGWRQAAAIAQRVVPAYRAFLAGPPPVERVAAARPVTVTLVRWPFT